MGTVWPVRPAGASGEVSSLPLRFEPLEAFVPNPIDRLRARLPGRRAAEHDELAGRVEQLERSVRA